MSDGFRVDLAAVEARAGHIDELAERVRMAAPAARPLGLEAFGQIGQVFTATAARAADSGSAAVEALGRSTAGLGAQLRASGAEYRRVEAQNAARFSGGPR